VGTKLELEAGSPGGACLEPMYPLQRLNGNRERSAFLGFGLTLYALSHRDRISDENSAGVGESWSYALGYG